MINKLLHAQVLNKHQSSKVRCLISLIRMEVISVHQTKTGQNPRTDIYYRNERVIILHRSSKFLSASIACFSLS